MNHDEQDILDNDFEDADLPSEDSLLYYEGERAKACGDLEKAYELFLKSLEIKKHNATHRELYSTLMAMGREEEAFFHIEKAYELHSKELRNATLYAKALYKRNKIVEAKFILAKILKQSATFGPAQRLLQEIEQEGF